MRPGDDVAAGVETQKEEDEEGDDIKGAQKVDARDERLVGDFWRDLDEEVDEHSRDETDGDLDEEGKAPAPR